ncbi:MAG: hypothetical protein HY317_06185 [Acidobacteria bacterium]|nr:hypothetical protein [Acidobacteriota bacterium]
MMLRRTWRTGLALALVGAALLPACGRRKPAEVNDVTASFKVNRTRAPLGSAIEVTYTWTTGAGFKKLAKDYRALVHFLDPHKVMLFDEDHVPVPPPTSWEPGKTYSYTRTKFIPNYPYVGEVEVRMGLYHDRERVALKGDDAGMLEYRVGKMELLPQTENIFLVYKDGWHNPETHPQNPAQERQWTKKDALVSFKNPKKDVLLYLEADTCFKCFPQQPVLTVSVGDNVGVTVPIDNAEVFLKKIRVKAQDLGSEDWVDLRFGMNQSFVPKLMNPPMNNDDRELGLLVYHLYVGEADKVGDLPAEAVVDAAPLAPVPAAKAASKPAPSKTTPAKKS